MGLRSRHRHARPPAGPGARRALVLYVLLWAVGAAAVTVGALALLRTGQHETVTLPPVQEIKLPRAARDAGCEYRRRGGSSLNPPVSGPAKGRPARAGVYDEPVPVGALIAAMRRGVIVIQYRQGLGGDLLGELEDLQRAVPTGTIVAPNGTGMPYAIAVTAYRRLLGCRTFTEGAIDALRLFRGRFVGSGPNA